MSYRIVMYVSEALVQKHQCRCPKQTRKFSAVLLLQHETVVNSLGPQSTQPLFPAASALLPLE